MTSARSIQTLLTLALLAALPNAAALASTKALAPRRSIALDGSWQVEQGTMQQIPATFSHTVVVPGLIDMAQPAFPEVGKKSGLREVFWYRRTFTVDGAVPAVAILKIHKARYGAKIILNGKLVGEHLPCFTPALIDVRDALKGDGAENELVIRVGANRESLPEGVPGGWDFEKYLYIPGIYDSVELILSGAPYIGNVQVVPDIAAGKVRVVAEIAADDRPSSVVLQGEVSEARSGAAAGSATASAVALGPGETRQIELTIPISNCRLWSPEDPFLYQLNLRTGADAVGVRFGMRSFRFDPETKRAVLNGKPYYMRGTNVCAYRFFEDAERADRPWRAEWVRRLHQTFRSMHWNSIRYCIGFPPELWYDIADEEGFLIQDEFPIWLLGDAPEHPTAEKIAPQYTEWMRERWNHPCVVIWDAQNESFTDETGKALQMVRHLDLSRRPWENGWSEPQAKTDFVESHPYLFIRAWSGQEPFRLKEIVNVSGVPGLNSQQQKLDVPIVINEYGWLWLNRDGTPTCLTDKVYESLLGRDSTTEQRRMLYARYLAALTEFWRCHRECAGVLHFCGLGYSRPSDKPRPEGGATSDHFIDLEQLRLEPHFAEYVRDAFNPVGVMLDFWAETLPVGSRQSLKVVVINDLYEPWQGTVRLRVLSGDREVSATTRDASVAALGSETFQFAVDVPQQPGKYTLAAELLGKSGKPIRSLRDVEMVPTSQGGSKPQ